MHDELGKHIENNIHLPHEAFTYGDGPLGSKRLRRAVARFLNRRLNAVTPLQMEHVVVTNGVSHSIEHTSWAFCDPGDGYLLGQPHYRAFIPDISLRPGTEVLKVKFGAVDPMSIDAVASYEQAILAAQQRGVRTRALMLCSPHNPLGRCYSRAAIVAYMRLCQKYQIHLVSDEIYALSTWRNPHDASPPPEPFTSVLSIPLDGLIDPSLVHVLWGVSKDFGANGLRVGFVISQHNETLMNALLEVSIYSYASSVADHIVANILEDDAWVDAYIETNQERLSESFSFAVGFLNDHDIPYAPGSNAAFFLWIDLGKAFLDRHPDRRGDGDGDVTAEVTALLLKNKVFLGTGSLFGAEQPGIFRLTFSHPRPFLVEALKRIVKAIGEDLKR